MAIDEDGLVKKPERKICQKHTMSETLILLLSAIFLSVLFTGQFLDVLPRPLSLSFHENDDDVVVIVHVGNEMLNRMLYIHIYIELYSVIFISPSNFI